MLTHRARITCVTTITLALRYCASSKQTANSECVVGVLAEGCAVDVYQVRQCSNFARVWALCSVV